MGHHLPRPDEVAGAPEALCVSDHPPWSRDPGAEPQPSGSQSPLAIRELREFRAKSPTEGSRHGSEAGTEPEGAEHTPEEQIDAAYGQLRAALAAEVLERVKEQSPAFFEQLVLDVLRAMGYGGTHEDAVERLGQSGDEGVDGMIREDELGLDLIYVQAKRWQNPVGRPEIQKFFGALHGKRASRGGGVHHHVLVHSRCRLIRRERHAAGDPGGRQGTSSALLRR